MRGLAFWSVVVVVCAGCRTLPVLLPSVLAQARAEGGFITGTPVGLTRPVFLNREDLVYDARFSPDGQRVALSRLDAKSYFLSVHRLRDGAPGHERQVNVEVVPLEFDVEALEFSPDGQLLVTASRDGVARLFRSNDGALLKQWVVEEPLTAVAIDRAGAWVAVGSSLGLVTVLSLPDFGFLAELRAHDDEVRGLASAPGGRLYSGGWDKRLAALEVVADGASSTSVRAHFDAEMFRVAFDGRALVPVQLDERLDVVVISSALASALNLDVRALQETTTVPMPMGAQVAKVSRGHSVRVKGLMVGALPLAVCDVCLPKGASALLGRPFTAQVAVAFDAAGQEVMLSPKGPEATMAPGKRVQQVARYELQGAVNDLSVDVAGAVLGVALSETKALRTREVYEREKKHVVEPTRAWDCAARVSASTGEVLEVRRGHRGVVSTVGVSPDGHWLVSAGWDRQVLLHGPAGSVHSERLGNPPRRARFSPDGSRVLIASWTPINPFGDHQSEPAAVVYEVAMRDAAVSKAAK